MWYSNREKKSKHEFKTIHTSVNGTKNCAIYASEQSDGSKNVYDDKWLEFHLKFVTTAFHCFATETAMAIAFRLIQFVYLFWFEVGIFMSLTLTVCFSLAAERALLLLLYYST